MLASSFWLLAPVMLAGTGAAEMGHGHLVPQAWLKALGMGMVLFAWAVGVGLVLLVGVAAALHWSV